MKTRTHTYKITLDEYGRKEEVRVSGIVPIDAPSGPVFAVRIDCDSSGIPHYQIDHLPTGLSLISYVKSRKDALMILEDLLTLSTEYEDNTNSHSKKKWIDAIAGTDNKALLKFFEEKKIVGWARHCFHKKPVPYAEWVASSEAK